jgi:hypothetical protein
VKILSLGITQHFADEIHWVLDLVVGILLSGSSTLGT